MNTVCMFFYKCCLFPKEYLLYYLLCLFPDKEKLCCPRNSVASQWIICSAMNIVYFLIKNICLAWENICFLRDKFCAEKMFALSPRFHPWDQEHAYGGFGLKNINFLPKEYCLKPLDTTGNYSLVISIKTYLVTSNGKLLIV